jgi:hypothetical protein
MSSAPNSAMIAAACRIEQLLSMMRTLRDMQLLTFMAQPS